MTEVTKAQHQASTAAVALQRRAEESAAELLPAQQAELEELHCRLREEAIARRRSLTEADKAILPRIPRHGFGDLTEPCWLAGSLIRMEGSTPSTGRRRFEPGNAWNYSAFLQVPLVDIAEGRSANTSTEEIVLDTIQLACSCFC